MRRLVAALAFGSIVLSAPALAQTRAVNVEIDGTTRVQLRGAASSVVVGNPAIADVTVTDANTLFIVGKGYGTTEVVVVDEIGRTLFQGEVSVTLAPPEPYASGAAHRPPKWPAARPALPAFAARPADQAPRRAPRPDPHAASPPPAPSSVLPARRTAGA